MSIKIGLCGYSGIVGKIILEKSVDYPSIRIVEKFNSKSAGSELEDFCKNSEIIIDFSDSFILEKLLKGAIKYSNKLVIGTTGLSKKHFKLIEQASKQIAILYSANMSLGANLASMISATAASILRDFDIDIIDYHRKGKKDSPSGTALSMAKDIGGKTKIAFHSVRAGDIFGEHEILFSGEDEILSINHRVLNRKCFARGAIEASLWIANKGPGLYSIKDSFHIL